MANTTLTASVIAKTALPILENELGFLGKMNRAWEKEFSQDVNGYKIGASVDIRRPADFTIRSGATLSTQDVIEGKNTLTVDQQKGVDFEFTSQELTLDVAQLGERVIKPAMSALVNEIAEDVLSVAYKGFYNWAGTPGQVVNSFSDWAKGPERMDKMAIPQAGRCGVLNPSDHWGMVGSLTGLGVESAVGGALRSGRLGMIGNIDSYSSAVTPTHTVGAHGGTPVVDGASQNVTYDTAKNTWTQSLVTDGWATSSGLKEGDVFTIAGVNMVNPKTKADTGMLQQFVLTADVTTNASAAADTNLTISPPIIASGQHQTVTAAPADNATITYLGTASTAYDQSLMFHDSAIALAMVPMVRPAGAVDVGRESRNGVSVRVIPVYDVTNDKSQWRLDVLYGRKVADPRLGLRLSGTA